MTTTPTTTGLPHRSRGLRVEDEAVRRALRPAPCDVRIRHGVEGRVDLDRVESLGVIPEPRLGRRDAPWVPGLHQAFVGPAAGAEAYCGAYEGDAIFDRCP